MFTSSRIPVLHPRSSQLIRRLQVLRPISRSTWRSFSNSSSTYAHAPQSSPSSAVPVPSPSSHSNTSHNSLSSFLAYARATSLSATSTVYVGTRYEYLAQDALRCLGFSLTRSGGRSDGGIDLYGTWTLPGGAAPHPLRCIVQCKALTKKVGPNLVRELEGACASATAERGRPDPAATVGVLCATREASKGVREAIRRSTRGIVWVMLPDADDDDAPRVRQVLWNERVAELGATGVGVGVVYGAPTHDGGDDGAPREEVRLMWKGEVWEPEIPTKESGPS